MASRRKTKNERVLEGQIADAKQQATDAIAYLRPIYEAGPKGKPSLDHYNLVLESAPHERPGHRYYSPYPHQGSFGEAWGCLLNARNELNRLRPRLRKLQAEIEATLAEGKTADGRRYAGYGGYRLADGTDTYPAGGDDSKKRS